MAVELATAYVNLVPSARGIVGNIGKELLPIEGAAAASGSRAGSALGGNLSKSLKSVLGSLPTASLGPLGGLLGASLVVGFGAALVGIGQQFGSAKVQITRETGALGAQLTATFDTVKRVMHDVPDSVGGVTTAVDELVRRGVPLGATFDKLAKQELELAHITKSDLAANVETTTALFTKFNVPLLDQPKALDAIFKGYQASGKGLSDLTGSLQSGGAALTQFGFDIFSSTALIAGLERAGVNVQPALAGLKKAFGAIAKEGGDPKKALADLVAEFSDGTPKTKAMADAIKLFGTRSGVELATAIQAGKFNVKDLLKTITDGKGGIEDTAAATRTFGEQLSIFKNQALVALQPIASEVWKTIRAAILEAVAPVESFALAFAHLAQELAPVGAAIAVLAGGALLGLLSVVKLVATGVDFIATVLSHIPGPVLIAAGAVAILAKAFFELRALGALGSAADAVAGLSLGLGAMLNPVTAVIGGLVILGGIVTLFAGHASAAARESKDLSAALFGAAGSGSLFASGIGSAAQGLADFLAKQDQAGKLGNLDKVLAGTNTSLKDVATAVAGTSQQFDALKAGLADTSGFNAQQRSLLGLKRDVIDARGAAQGLSQAQKQAVFDANDATAALDQQRDAFVRGAEAQIQLVARTDPASKAIADQAEKIAHATTGTRGYGAALDFLNAGVAENARKTDAATAASAAFAPKLADLKSQIIAGAIGTNDAAEASAKWGLSLEVTKAIISDTQGQIKSFTDAVTKGLPTVKDALDSYTKTVESDFSAASTAMADHKSSAHALFAQLNKDSDPATFTANLLKEVQSIREFQTNIDKLSQFAPHLAAFFAQQGPAAAGGIAAAFASSEAKAKVAEGAAGLVATATQATVTDFTTKFGPQVVGAVKEQAGAINTTFAATLHLAPPVQSETAKALIALSAREQFSSASGDTASAASQEWRRRFLLANSTTGEVAAAAVAAGRGQPVTAAAARTASSASSAFGSGLDFHGKTAAALVNSKGAYDPQNTIDLANSARAGGRVIGFQFDKGIQSGIQAGAFDVSLAAGAVAAAAEAAAKAKLGIKSPSLVGIEIGGQFVAGIALGLGGTASVSTAATHLAAVITGSFSTFESAALGALPSVSTAVSSFATTLTSAASTASTDYAALVAASNSYYGAAAQVTAINAKIAADLKSFKAGPTAAGLQQLAKDYAAQTAAMSAASAAWGPLTAAVKTYTAAQAALAQASDVSKFTKSIQHNSAATVTFQAEINKLVTEGFPALAAQLAQLGPDAAGSLAAGFASDASKAKVANAALKTQQTVDDSFKVWLEKTFPALFSDAGTAAGTALGTSTVAALAQALGTTSDQVLAIIKKIQTGAAPAPKTVAFAQLNAAPAIAAQPVSVVGGTQHFEFTIVLPDGQQVKLKPFSTPLPAPSGTSLERRVIAALQAVGT